MISWQGVDDMTAKAYTSHNGNVWSTASDGAIRYFDVEGNNVQDMTVRDPGTTYYNGKWYVPITTAYEGSHDFKVYVGESLLALRLVRCKLGSGAFSESVSTIGGAVPSNAIWAPKFFVYGGDLYVAVSIRFTSDQVDAFGTSGISGMRPYYARCTDIDALTFDTPSPFAGLSYTDSRIDANLYNIGAEWWFTCKNDISGHTEIYKSSSPLDLTSSVLQEISWSTVANKAEGQSLTVSTLPNGGSEMRIWADLHNQGNYASVRSLNGGMSWTSPEIVSFPECVRHGNVLDLMSLPEDDRANAIASWDQFIAASGVQSHSTLISQNLGNGSVSIVPMEGRVYYINDTNSVTLTIQERCARQFWLLAGTGTTSAGITVLSNSIFPTEFKVGYGVSYDRLVEVRLNGLTGQYYIVGSASPIPKSGWGSPTGTATRASFDTSAVGIIALAERVKALIDDLKSHGLLSS